MRKLLTLFVFIFTQYTLYSQVTINITHNKRIKDYSTIIKNSIDRLILLGGGNLLISEGDYPVLKEIVITNEINPVTINIVGKINSKGEISTRFFDTNKRNTPHSFFIFYGNISKPVLIVNIKDIRIEGNNQPHSTTHPFVNKRLFSRAIAGFNVSTMNIDNVTIENFYGDGIVLAQGMSVTDKRFRIESPVISNCKILNTWGWNSAIDENNDAIMLWQVNRPTVKNCTIINDINYTKNIGRCGIVIEHNSENALIVNNKIGGYDRNIHLECDFGGHVIENNNFILSLNGITLSYDCNQDVKRKNMYSPICISKNTFFYDNEFEKNNIVRNDFGYIYIYKPSFVLDGLIIENNVFYRNSKKPFSITEKDNSYWKDKSKNFLWLNKQSNIRITDNVIK